MKIKASLNLQGTNFLYFARQIRKKLLGYYTANRLVGDVYR